MSRKMVLFGKSVYEEKGGGSILAHPVAENLAEIRRCQSIPNCMKRQGRGRRINRTELFQGRKWLKRIVIYYPWETRKAASGNNLVAYLVSRGAGNSAGRHAIDFVLKPLYAVHDYLKVQVFSKDHICHGPVVGSGRCEHVAFWEEP